jgi:hypothetical protein
MMLKKNWNVWMSGTEDKYLPLLRSLLNEYHIEYKEGWKERVPHPNEGWPMPEDYKAQYTVSFSVPEALRVDSAFVHRLDALVPLTEELDFEQ